MNQNVKAIPKIQILETHHHTSPVSVDAKRASYIRCRSRIRNTDYGHEDGRFNLTLGFS